MCATQASLIYMGYAKPLVLGSISLTLFLFQQDFSVVLLILHYFVSHGSQFPWNQFTIAL